MLNMWLLELLCVLRNIGASEMHKRFNEAEARWFDSDPVIITKASLSESFILRIIEAWCDWFVKETGYGFIIITLLLDIEGFTNTRVGPW